MLYNRNKKKKYNIGIKLVGQCMKHLLHICSSLSRRKGEGSTSSKGAGPSSKGDRRSASSSRGGDSVLDIILLFFLFFIFLFILHIKSNSDSNTVSKLTDRLLLQNQPFRT